VSDIKIAVDAMGGDYAPEAIVEGVVDYIKSSKEHNVILVGKEKEIKK
jgi:glycerol-3-phosphate acyltransferase PlsX